MLSFLCDLLQLLSFTLTEIVSSPSLATALSDDLVLARLSSLLVKSSFDSYARDLNINTSDRLHSSSAAVASIPALSIVHDISLVVPTPLSSSTFVQSYCINDDYSTVPSCRENRKINAPRKPSNPLADLLKDIGIEEVETLNQHPDGPTSGQCQFSSVAMALSKESSGALHFNNRPDLELRQLALHTIASNPDMYADFLMNATVGRRTRSVTRVTSEVGGRSVDLDNYLRTMSNPSCDGDAITLQALCDSLKITVRIVKPVKADAYQKEWQQEKLAELLNAPVKDIGYENIGHVVDVLSADSEDSDNGVCETDTSISTCLKSDSSTYSNPDDNIEEESYEISGFANMQCLYISHELQPRPLPSIDSRVKDVQRVTRGRLVWLSHIGDEAHYRFLKPIKFPFPKFAESIAEAQLSRSFRISRLRNICDLVDEYKWPKFRLSEVPADTPCCALCLDPFQTSLLCQVVSPSSCRHHYHLDCLVSWNGSVSSNCPSCMSAYGEMYFLSSGESATPDSIPALLPCIRANDERREEWEAPRDRTATSDAFLKSSFDKMIDWVNRNKHVVEPMSDRLNIRNISSLVEKLLAIATSNTSVAKTKKYDCESDLQELSKKLSVELFQDQNQSCLPLSSLLDAGFLSVLRVLLAQKVSSNDAIQEGIDSGILELLQLLMHFTSQGLFLTRFHLQLSGGLLKLLLTILKRMATNFANENAVNTLRKILRSCCRFAISIPPAFNVAGGATSTAAGSVQSKQSGCPSDTLQDECFPIPILMSGCKGKKRFSVVSDSDKSKSANKKRKTALSNKKRRVERSFKCSNPSMSEQGLSRSLVQRAPGKRLIKPVATTNISHEHLGLRCYRGAL